MCFVNQYNFEEWYLPLKEMKMEDEKGEKYDLMSKVDFIDLTEEEVQKIIEINEKTSGGK